MKFQVQTDVLAAAIQHVVPAAARHSAFDSTRYILLEAATDHVTVKATDLDIFIARLAPAVGARSGAALVTPKALSEVLAGVPGDEIIEIETLDGVLHVAGAGWRCRLFAPPVSAWPTWHGEHSTPSPVCLDPDACTALARALRFVEPSASRDESRPNLRSAFIEMRAGCLRVAATNGAQLALVDVPEVVWDPELRLLVRLDGLQMLADLLANGPTASLSATGARLHVATPECSLVVPLEDAAFPDYTVAIPKSSSRRVVVARDRLLASLRRAAPVTDRDGRVEVLVDPDGLTLRTMPSDDGACEEALPIIDAGGEPGRTAFDVRKLMGIIERTSGDAVELLLNEPLSPAIIRSQGDERTFHLLMPVRP